MVQRSARRVRQRRAVVLQYPSALREQLSASRSRSALLYNCDSLHELFPYHAALSALSNMSNECWASLRVMFYIQHRSCVPPWAIYIRLDFLAGDRDTAKLVDRKRRSWQPSYMAGSIPSGPGINKLIYLSLFYMFYLFIDKTDCVCGSIRYI